MSSLDEKPQKCINFGGCSSHEPLDCSFIRANLFFVFCSFVVEDDFSESSLDEKPQNGQTASSNDSTSLALDFSPSHIHDEIFRYRAVHALCILGSIWYLQVRFLLNSAYDLYAPVVCCVVGMLLKTDTDDTYFPQQSNCFTFPWPIGHFEFRGNAFRCVSHKLSAFIFRIPVSFVNLYVVFAIVCAG